MVKVAQKLEITVQPVIGLRFHSSSMQGVVRVTLWLALLNEVRQSGAHAPICTAKESDEVVERRLSSFGTTQPGCNWEEKWAVFCRDVVDDVIEKPCYNVFDYDTEPTSTTENSDNYETHLLPDGNIITVDAEVFRVAALVDRGPAARSTRAELLGDRVRGYMSGCCCQRKYTAL